MISWLLLPRIPHQAKLLWPWWALSVWSYKPKKTLSSFNCSWSEVPATAMGNQLMRWVTAPGGRSTRISVLSYKVTSSRSTKCKFYKDLCSSKSSMLNYRRGYRITWSRQPRDRLRGETQEQVKHTWHWVIPSQRKPLRSQPLPGVAGKGNSELKVTGRHWTATGLYYSTASFRSSVTIYAGQTCCS